MGAYKDFLIGVEELVFECLERGMDDPDKVYSYVKRYESRVDRQTVKEIVESYHVGDERELWGNGCC